MYRQDIRNVPTKTIEMKINQDIFLVVKIKLSAEFSKRTNDFYVSRGGYVKF